MILGLRNAVPLLQRLTGWAACTSVPPRARRFAETAFSRGNTAPGGSEAEDLPGSSSTSASGEPAEQAKPKRRYRTKTSAAAEPAASTAAVADADSGAAGTSKGSSSTQPKASSRRKAASAEEQQAQEPSDGVAPAPPARRTQRKKQEEEPPSAPEAAALDGAEASTSAAGSATSMKRSSSRSSSRGKKAGGAEAAQAASDDDDSAKERLNIQNLPYEDCLVLPRKAEQLLIALGLRQPQHPYGAATAAGAGAFQATPFQNGSSSSTSGPLRNVMELAGYLGWRHPKDLATPLLLAQYQGYLGPSPDYLYDLFCLDFDPPHLASDTVRAAAVAAGRTARSSVVAAKGTPPESLAKAAMDRLREDVGEAAVAAQEVVCPQLTEAQVELFLLDWASASLAGMERTEGTQYLARRCAALQLTRPIVLERLYRYAVQGASLQQLAAGSSRSLKLSQPMDALVEGVKAGVRLDREQLLTDFRLCGPGDPLRDMLPVLWEAVSREAARSADPGSSLFYSTLVDKLRLRPELSAAMGEQESRWQTDQGERDGSTLTKAQVRLLFHLIRLERFRAEQQAHRMGSG